MKNEKRKKSGVEWKRTSDECLNGINKFARPFDVFDRKRKRAHCNACNFIYGE